MLANGAKLGYKKSGGSTYTDLKGLKEIPEMGVDPERVENTTLTDKVKQYENGIGDAGELQYKFKYDNREADSPYRVMRAAQDTGETLSFQETLSDGTMTTYDAQVSVKRTGGGVNGVIEFTLTMALQSGLTVTDPVVSGS
ncbi:phage tail tube protein [Cuneatibacter caecimuris]|uniref:Tail tube protein n=1 Tax=Cuneatibacter caecimuris TaxID=1796618 RepID=A0A4Q7PPQ1_9FIRM|nr:phage tail tube protein [Cuneatibacter caecimuris]RZT02904.1 tail tube protein [Cuneatibacter caecimuris]